MRNSSMIDDDDEDLYEGFNYSIDLAPPQTASQPPQSSYMQYGMKTGNSGNPPGTAFRAPPSQMGRQMQGGRLMTGQQGGGEVARPMTSVAGAGFSVSVLLNFSSL